MIDEMTNMQEEISKLKAEVGRLRNGIFEACDWLASDGDVKQAAPEMISEAFKVLAKLLDPEKMLDFAANVTSEAPQATAPKFKVGDRVYTALNFYRVIQSCRYDEEKYSWVYTTTANDYEHEESRLTRA